MNAATSDRIPLPMIAAVMIVIVVAMRVAPTLQATF